MERRNLAGVLPMPHERRPCDTERDENAAAGNERNGVRNAGQEILLVLLQNLLHAELDCVKNCSKPFERSLLQGLRIEKTGRKQKIVPFVVIL
jgi:hypothetical protein